MEYDLVMDYKLLAAGLALAIKGGALFHDEHRRYDIPENAGCAVELDALPGRDVPFNLPAYNPDAHLDLGFNLAILS
jgi:hypothetical protein